MSESKAHKFIKSKSKQTQLNQKNNPFNSLYQSLNLFYQN